jgi:hypothetical protein
MFDEPNTCILCARPIDTEAKNQVTCTVCRPEENDHEALEKAK